MTHRLLLTFSFFTATLRAQELPPEQLPQPGVPAGELRRMEPFRSQHFPETTRDWWIYLPAKTNTPKPAAVMVFQDGHDYVNLKGAWRVPTVFDNLIHSGTMPATVGIFINPGHKVDAPPPQSPWKSNNRSFEYDTLNDQFARFLIEEILPVVAQIHPLTEDPNQRAICGASSGGICAFTTAWERPDQFRKVLSTIGSFTNIRGGHAYPYLIRSTETKPLRIWLQDGRNDLDNPHGNWPLGNQQMASALRYMNYDFEFVFTEGEHNSKDAGPLLPTALKWLWRE
jgi:enterochelin esterase family protein